MGRCTPESKLVKRKSDGHGSLLLGENAPYRKSLPCASMALFFVVRRSQTLTRDGLQVTSPAAGNDTVVAVAARDLLFAK
jgi:hypothetical protein